ncbi:hypothetical protein CCMSSC00406_0002946 [Pleurotus cornucopiae]|uniref:Uncharacterized protein n=1 Tax=Pleurotus cornucopiae TaxID=5321 RepID=A0ACB7J4C8_PLECO|nr:hypothetical protein CCMSSC00406_0002946 [Pleurotus cornucopiae]
MQNPEQEIRDVVKNLTTAPSPDVQKATAHRYLTHDAGFRHPVCAVKPQPGSRDTVLGVYQWYRVMSPKLELDVKSVTYNQEESMIVLDIVQTFHIFISPFKPAPSRLMVRLTLREENGLHYIAMQEDFYHPTDLMALLVPPLVPVVYLILLITGIACNAYARLAQTLGYWEPTETSAGAGRGDGAESDAGLKWE